MRKELLVEGMTCGHCEKAVKDSLGELEGVNSVLVDLDSKKVEVVGENLEDKLIRKAVKEAGYEVLEIK